MKIVITTDGIFPFSVGGMQRHSRFLVEGLARNHEDVELHVIHPHDELIFSSFENVTEHHLTEYNRHHVYLVDCYRYSQAIADVLVEIDPDVIYAQGLTMWGGIKHWGQITLVNPHGLEPYQAMGMKNRLLAVPFKGAFNYIFKKASKVVSLGGKLTTILESVVSPEKIVTLPNGIDLDLFQKREREPSEFNFLFVGRFARNKGITHLINVSIRLIQEGHSFKLNLIGKGPLYESLCARYQGLEWIQFFGFASDEEIGQAYRNCSTFVLPTLFEGMPTVVLEAMASGAPIIVSDVGACKEMVDAENGWIVEPGNEDDLYQAMKESLIDSFLEDKSRASVEKAQKFSWTEIIRQTIEHL